MSLHIGGLIGMYLRAHMLQRFTIFGLNEVIDILSMERKANVSHQAPSDFQWYFARCGERAKPDARFTLAAVLLPRLPMPAAVPLLSIFAYSLKKRREMDLSGCGCSYHLLTLQESFTEAFHADNRLENGASGSSCR